MGLRLAEYPSPQLELLMEDFKNLGLRLEEYSTPRIGTSHGGLRKFGFEASRIPPPHTGLELLMEDLESLCVYVETSRCIPHGCHLVENVKQTLLKT